MNRSVVIDTVWTPCESFAHRRVHAVWAALIDLVGPDVMLVLGPWALSAVIFWPCVLVLLWIDVHVPFPSFLSFRIQRNDTLPLQWAASAPFRRRIWRVVAVAVRNDVCVALPCAWCMSLLYTWRGIGVTTALPTVTVVMLQLVGLIFVEEVLFYCAHRALHHPTLYVLFHKQHHEFTAPLAVSARYCSAVEHICASHVCHFALLSIV